jgi:hypothetical protein
MKLIKNNFILPAVPLESNAEKGRKHTSFRQIDTAKQRGNYCTLLSVWELFFTDEILNKIL